MSRSLNKVELIGNLTRDPELRYTPSGAAVCTFGLATNWQWTTDTGDKKENVEFHKIVAWNKLAELCSQLLTKGRKVYVEGRLQTRKWTGQDEVQRSTTEIVINDMIILDSRTLGGSDSGGDDFDVPDDFGDEVPDEKGDGGEGEEKSSPKKKASEKQTQKSKATSSKNKTKASKDDEEDDDDIPF